MLFRRETEEARANAWLGRVLLVRPMSFAILTGASAAIVVAMLAYFIHGEYTRKARVAGVIAPVHGVVRIVAPQAGVVQALAVAEGETIDAGATIITLADARVSDRHEAVGLAIASRLADRFQALSLQRAQVLSAMRSEQALISRRRAALDREASLLGNELATQSRRGDLARHALDRAVDLARTGFVSPAGVDRERDAVLENESRIEAMRRTRAGLLREAEGADLEAQSAYARAQSQVAAIDAQLAALDQERVERQLQYRATIVSPTPGFVATILVEPGQAIAAGTTVATLIPADDRLEAQLFAPSRSIGFVRSGQEVLVRFLAYPHQKFGSHPARIVAIASSPLPPPEMGYVPPDGTREPLYRIKAALKSQTISAYGRSEPLQAGMQVEADIQLDRRRLIEWIFEPVLSLAGRT
jgi:membrane fusion protein